MAIDIDTILRNLTTALTEAGYEATHDGEFVAIGAVQVQVSERNNRLYVDHIASTPENLVHTVVRRVVNRIDEKKRQAGRTMLKSVKDLIDASSFKLDPYWVAVSVSSDSYTLVALIVCHEVMKLRNVSWRTYMLTAALVQDPTDATLAAVLSDSLEEDGADGLAHKVRAAARGMCEVE